MVKITKVIGRQVLDSRGNPTVAAEIHFLGAWKVQKAWLVLNCKKKRREVFYWHC